MTEPFGHEKLIVYQKGMRFAVLRGALLERLSRRVAACDHLDRGAESILLNIAHASSTGSATERIVYLGHANGSALECAACLDVLVAKSLLGDEDVYPAKSLLAEIVCMLITMRKTAASRVREDHAGYRTRKGRLFDHEDLDGQNQAACYETAFKATIQSASLVDLATAGGVADVTRAEAGRERLRRIAAMLTALSKVAAHA